jgi:serine/threonine-protein kinase HipA
VKHTKIEVSTPQGFGGLLRHSDEQYFFDALGNSPESAVALSMPNRAKQFASTELLPIFQMNIPEGRVLEEIRSRLAKTSVVDPMLLLSITGSVAPIGRLRCKAEGMSPQIFSQGERLAEIPAWDGTQDIFRDLFDKYVLSSGISGVQPKVLVPEAVMTPALNKIKLMPKSSAAPTSFSMAGIPHRCYMPVSDDVLELLMSN